MTSLTLRQLEYAVAVADELHFGRAASRCNVTQPGLSTQVRALEERLGVELFERSRRHVALTGPGRDVIDRARRILADVEDLASVAGTHAGDVIGAIDVGAISTMAPYVLPSTVATLRRLWPDATLRLSEQRSTEVVALVADGALDLGLIALPADTGPLVVHPVVDESFVVAVPAHDIASSSDPIESASLRDLPILLLEAGHCFRDHALAACERAGVARSSEIPSAGLSTLTQMVAAGMGATLLPRSAVDVEARPGTGVVTRPLIDRADARPVGRTLAVVWRPSDPRRSLFAAAADRLAPAWAELVRHPAPLVGVERVSGSAD